MLPIQKLLIGYNCSARYQAPEYIVIHDTADPNATAQNEHDYFAGGNREASADFFVDSDNIIQIIDYHNNYSWAVGDGHGEFGITNGNSVSIEMCIGEDGQPAAQTIQNTIDLTCYLMEELNIPLERVVRHYDCSRKNCPQSFNANSWEKWNEFKKRLCGSGDEVKVQHLRATAEIPILQLVVTDGAPILTPISTYAAGDTFDAMSAIDGYWVVQYSTLVVLVPAGNTEYVS